MKSNTRTRNGVRDRKRAQDRLSHVDARGRARMVDVGDKPETVREAVARAEVRMRAETLRRLATLRVAKGNVAAVARLAGIMAAKRTADLIPLCHPLRPTVIEVDVTPQPRRRRVCLESRVCVTDRTGAEMEALVAVSVAALAIYDMCKAIDREMVIEAVRLVSKSGGKSGTFVRRGERG